MSTAPRLAISSVKVTYQQGRWEVAVVWEGLPFLLRVGTGDSPEEAVENALKQVVQDTQDELLSTKLDRGREQIGSLPAVRMERGER
jgi:hypothetical protein